MEKKSSDPIVLIIVLLLMAFGVMMVYSASAILAEDRYSDSLYFLKRQLVFTGLGLGILFTFKNINYHLYYKLTYPILAVNLLLLLMVFIPGLGHSAGGAQRWLKLPGFTLQPSELAKFSVILFVAYSLSKKGEKIRDFRKGFLPTIGISGLFAAIVLLQKDLGTTFVIVSVIFMMLLISGTKLWYLLAGVVAAAPALYFLIFAVDFRRKRILAFLDPWQDQLGSGFQIIQSYVAFNSGGLMGDGLGQGKQKLFYLPAAHTDFIFSVLGEELGLIGVLFVIGLFILLMVRGIRIASRAPDAFGAYLAAGITILITCEALINLGVVMGLLPTKGLPMPFISHGGTFLLVLCLMTGVLLNISSQSRESTPTP